MWASLSRAVRTPLSTLWKVCVDAQSLRCVQLCEPMDCSPPGSTIHGIFQARILKWVAISFRGSSWPSDGICVSYIAGGFFTAEPPGSPTLKGYVATSLFSLLVLTIEKKKIQHADWQDHNIYLHQGPSRWKTRLVFFVKSSKSALNFPSHLSWAYHDYLDVLLVSQANPWFICFFHWQYYSLL